MLQTTMPRIIVLGLALSASFALAQSTPDVPQEKVVVVPLGGEPFDAGQPVAEFPPVPQQVLSDAPVQPETRTFEALPPPLPAPEQLDANPPQIIPGPGAMLDGHPREGAFLSGPGSFTFLMHHTLMTGLGVLATQMVPRAIDASRAYPAVPDTRGGIDIPAGGCDPANPRATPPQGGAFADVYKNVNSCADIFGGEGARLAYLTGTLLGAGVGFASAAVWQFNNWISPRSANFGIISSFVGGMFLGSIADLATQHGAAYTTAWLTLIGSSAGAWLAAVVGGGDIPLNKATLIASGAAWAMIYTALIVAIVTTTGGGMTPRTGLDVVMITPALGAATMALATLKFNPSTTQIMRANLFGVAVGGAVLLLSGLLLGPATGFTKSPVPYILAGVASIGTKTLVSLLWADAADNSATAYNSTSDRKYRSVW